MANAGARAVRTNPQLRFCDARDWNTTLWVVDRERFFCAAPLPFPLLHDQRKRLHSILHIESEIELFLLAR